MMLRLLCCCLKEQARTGAGVVMALAAGAGARNRLLL